MSIGYTAREVYAREVHSMAKGEATLLYIDWGENTAAVKTGQLATGDTVASCTVSVDDKPSGASDPTLGSVTVPTNSSSDDINGRVWSTGEATVVTVTMGASQTVGKYRLKFTATTTNSAVIVLYVNVLVRSGS